MRILGIDIGGTKCSVLTAEYINGTARIIKKKKISTDHLLEPYAMIEKLVVAADTISEEKPEIIGISCGGPLDSQKGVILSPPNLPRWDNVEIVQRFEEHYGTTAKLMNDADACALAEWKFGAGQGCKNLAFLTFGTGLGAGLIIDGKLYSGTNGNAGEAGHIRLYGFGPSGYGKTGSFEGFCSGGGIAQLGYIKALESIQRGENPLYYRPGDNKKSITAESIARAAVSGDKTAIEVYEMCGGYLGQGLSVIIDILNPEIIVIGSIFSRAESLLRGPMERVIQKEALGRSSACCRIVPAALGEQIGDYAAVAAAVYEVEQC